MLSKYVSEQKIEIPSWLGTGQWHLSKLTPITILFGKNGSGKSLLLRAWRDTEKEYCHYVVPERTGTLEFEAGLLQSQLDPLQRSQRTRGNFVDNYRQLIISRIQTYFLARGNARGTQLPGDPSELERALSKLLPDFTLELHPTKNPPYNLLRANNSAKVNNINELSSGEAQLLTIALDILTMGAIWEIQQTPKRIILVDEPDAHIHPDLQVRFADFLIDVAKRYKLQLIIATHSTTLLAAIGQFGAHDTSAIYLQKGKQNFVADPFTAIQKELAACLGGHALMGPLFSVPLLLVEGDDDYRIWSQVPRHHKVSLSVIPCHSADEVKRYQKVLEKIFSSLLNNSVAGYALLDGDQSLPKANPDTPQNRIKFVSLSCREAENLYLTNEVLSLLGTNWTEASKKIATQASNYGPKYELLASAESWNRKSHDIKAIINDIAEIIDPKNVLWTMRVAKAIGNDRPQGELASFLGGTLILSLWGQEAETNNLTAIG